MLIMLSVNSLYLGPIQLHSLHFLLTTRVLQPTPSVPIQIRGAASLRPRRPQAVRLILCYCSTAY